MKFLRHPRPWLILISILLGALDAWSTRYQVNPMGISYLDMGDALMRGEWHAALNGLWSPLYSVLLGLSASLVNPSPVWEYPFVHLINFLIYLAALFAFDFFLREVVRSPNAEGSDSETSPLPGWATTLLGYAVFLWSTLGLVKIATTAPDLLLSVFVFLAFAKLLQIKRGLTGWKSFLSLGIVLGVGYLAKATMFPIAPLFILGAVVLSARNVDKDPGIRIGATRFGIALLGFLVIAGPLVSAFSLSKQRLSFGDSGRLNYLWHVNRVPPFHWQGNQINGTPIHPTRKILDAPGVFEFASPFNATYPPWYDPSYWYDGARTQFNLGQQRVALFAATRVYVQLFTYTSNLVLVAGFLLLLYLGRRKSFRQIASTWPLLLVPLISFLLYLPVHVEPRYVAAFLPPLWIVLFGALRLPRTGQNIARYTVIGVSALLIFSQSVRSAGMFFYPNQSARVFESSMAVASELNRRGIQNGDAVGLVNFDPFWLPMVDWARLGRFRIVAELPNTEARTFAANTSSHPAVVAAFGKTGAKAIIAVNVPRDVNLPGWERVGNTSYYLFTVNQQQK